MAAHRLDEIGGQFTACWWCLVQLPVTASSSILLQAQRFLLPVSKDGMCKSASIALIKLHGFFFRCGSQCSANGPVVMRDLSRGISNGLLLCEANLSCHSNSVSRFCLASSEGKKVCWRGLGYSATGC